MTVGRIFATFIGCLIIGLIAGLITRNIIVAIIFPFLLVGFLLMWKNLKDNPPKDLEKEETQETPKTDVPQQKEVEVKESKQPEVQKPQPQPQPRQKSSQPPVSTNFPPTPPVL